MAYSDATVEASADFTRFDREFPAKLRQSVARATRIMTAEFRQAGTAAGDAFADAFAAQLTGLSTTARAEGDKVGRAFASAAERHTTDIDVGFDVVAARAEAIGRQFRTAVLRFVTRIPVTFQVNPTARTVGVVTGQRFRAGAIAGMGQIPIDFDISTAATQGRAAGRVFRTAAQTNTDNIPIGLGIGGRGGVTSQDRSLLAFFNNLSGRMRLIIALAPLLISALSSATVTLSGFIGSLLPLTGILAIIPSALAVFAAGITIIGLSAERIGQSIQNSLVPAFRGLRDEVGRIATAGLDRELQAVGRTLAGPLREGARIAADGFNELLLAITRFFAEAQTGVAFREIFESTGRVFQQLAQSIPALLDGFRDIAVAVLPAFEGLTGSISRLIDQFGQFLTRAATSGDALRWVDAALDGFEQLINIVIDVGSILVSVFQGAANVTGNLLSAFGRLTDQLARFLNSAEGAQLIEQIFAGLSAVAAPFLELMTALGPALTPFALIISQLLIAMTPLIGVVGQLVTALVNGLKPVLDALQPVITGLVDGLAAALAPLAPVLVQIGTTLAAAILPVSEELGAVFRQLGPLIGELLVAGFQSLMPLLEQLGPILITVWEAFQPLIPALIQLIPAITELAIAQIPLITVLAQLLTIVVRVAAVFVRFASEMTELGVVDLIVPGIRAMSAALNSVAAPLRSVSSALSSFSEVVRGFNLREFAENLGVDLREGFLDALENIRNFGSSAVDFVRQIPERIGAALAAIPQIIAAVFSQSVSNAAELIGFLIGNIIGLFTSLPSRIEILIGNFTTFIETSLANLWETLTQDVVSFIGNFILNVQNFVTRIPEMLANLGTLLAEIFSNAIESARQTVVDRFNSIIDFIRNIPSRLRELRSFFFEAGTQLLSSLADGLVTLGNRTAGFVDQIGRGLRNWINNNIIGPLERGIEKGLGGIVDISLPRLAKGAIVDNPTVAMLGEAGSEVVIPLTNPARAQQLVEQSGLESIVNMDKRTNVNVNVYIGDTELRDMVRTETDTAFGQHADDLESGPRYLGG